MSTKKELTELISDLSPDELVTLNTIVKQKLNEVGRTPPSAEQLKNSILQQIKMLRIDGILCYFNGTHFTPVHSQSQLESLIYQRFPGVLETVKMKTLKDCAYILFKLHHFEDSEPDEIHGFIGLNSGIYRYSKLNGEPLAYIHYSKLPYYTKFKPNAHNRPHQQEVPGEVPQKKFVPIFEEGWLERYNTAVSSDQKISDNQVPGIADAIYSFYDRVVPVFSSDYPIKITHTLNADMRYYLRDQKIDGVPAKAIRAADGSYCDDISRPQKTDQFFREIAGGDEELFERIWEVMACILVPDPKVKNFFLFEGLPDTGKSVLGNFIKSFFYDENVSSLDFTRLGDKHSSSTLSGTYLNMSMDLPSRPISVGSVAMLKMLTGDDSVTLEPKFKDVYSYRNRCRFVFASNHHIQLAEYDEAFVNRLVVIPFNYKPKEKNPNLLSELLEEKGVVASWALQKYYPQIKQKKFVFAGADKPWLEPVIYYSRSYREQQIHQIEQFVREFCTVTGKKEDYALTEAMRNGYIAYCEQEGFHSTCDKYQFTKLLRTVAGPTVERGRVRIGDKTPSCCYGMLYHPDPMTTYY